jgi:pyrroline-5-carboxylate reductase
MRYELGIIGSGKMAEAIARGVMGRGLLKAAQIIAADVSAERRALFQSELGIRSVESNIDAARNSRTLLLSVKPQQMAEALSGIGQAIDEKTLVVSIAAGITTRFIETNLGQGRKWRVVRSMPNTPMMIGEGMVAVSAGAHATKDDLAAAQRLFEAAAEVIEVREELLDAVTAVSGSGPAYFFYLVEQMIAAGVELGLSPADADKLARKTALGAARMLTASPGQTPAQLRKNVTSPGGTTQAAIEHMDSAAWPAIVRDAVKAAARRSRELGR